ncbi:hypothetical protein, partial [Anaerosolibacter sp.]|uniref:hypothetical protein n=1 Tax=Anaerosolibacter sp. TaxID=1872527 RepID=UPI0039EF65A1
MCEFYLNHYQKAYEWFEKVEMGRCHEEAIYKMFLCVILSNHFENEEPIILEIPKLGNKKKIMVYTAFKNLIMNHAVDILSHDKEESKEYANIIFALLNDLIKTDRPEIFETSLQLLNLIENDEVLLRLGKLYYYHGFYQLAYGEFMRSMHLFNKIDKEGLEMIGNVMDLGSELKN